MIDTILFDLDGTLLNTLDDLCDSVNYALNVLGVPTRTIDEVRDFVGNGVKLLISRALGEGHLDKFDECFKLFSAHYDKNKQNKTAPYLGIDEMLISVLSAGYKTAIVSNKYHDAVEELRKKFFSSVTIAIGEQQGLNAKPAPDMVFKAIKTLSSEPNSCVYVGDSDVDVATARNSNLPIIAVSWGFRSKELLKSLNADVIIDSPNQLLSAVDFINKRK